MDITIKESPPIPRCYRCGSEEISGICHHCGRLMCEAHVCRPTDDDRHATNEFGFLSELVEDATPVHCHHCQHVVVDASKTPLWIGSGVSFLGLILLGTDAMLLGLVLLLIGGGVIAWAARRIRQRKEENQQHQPRVPLLNLRRITLKQHVDGTLAPGENGKYRLQVDDPVGTVTLQHDVGTRLEPTIQHYENAFGDGSASKASVHAGFLAVLTGDTWHVDDPPRPLAAQVSPFVFQYTVPSVEQASLLEASTWTGETSYTRVGATHFEDDGGQLPLRMTVAYTPDLERKQLDIELFWDQRDHAKGPWIDDEPVLYSKIVLFFPPSFGEFESVSLIEAGSASGGGGQGPTPGLQWIKGETEKDGMRWKTITWENVRSEVGAKLTAAVQFEGVVPNPNDQDDSGGTVGANGEKGHQTKEPQGDRKRNEQVHAAVQGKLTDDRPGEDIAIHAFAPTGASIPVDTRVQHTFSLDAVLDASALSYQDKRILKSSNPPEGGTVLTQVYLGAVPNDETVTTLTAELTNVGGATIYVNSVVEGGATKSGELGIVNRHWDIKGRAYLDVWPTDFHIVLTGEEHFGSGVRAKDGKTEVELNIQATYASDEMRGKIDDMWDQIASVIDEVLELKSVSVDDVQPGVPGIDTAHVEDPRRRAEGQIEARDSALPSESPAAHSASVADSRGKGAASEGRGQTKAGEDERKSKLRAAQERLAKAEAALLDGGISEETYNRIANRIENEIRQLQEDR